MANLAPDSSKNTRRVSLGGEGVAGMDRNSQQNNQPIIVDLKTLNSLILQNIPPEVSVEPNSNWVALSSLGRNLPGYQFTGAEDTIKFDITWYCDDESREDVIRKCKWLEALSKPDGYDREPPLVQFIFGDLFRDSKFIVVDAPYKIGLFDRNYGLLPHYATQSLTLKKWASKNPTKVDILKIGT